MLGGLMVSAAMVLSSFGTTIIHLYLCVGVIGGKYSDTYLEAPTLIHKSPYQRQCNSIVRVSFLRPLQFIAVEVALKKCL